MFRKIHSNRDPRDTLYSELKKEFRVYTDKGNRISKYIAFKYPKLLFGVMITLMAVSALTAVLLHHTPAPQEKVKHRSETAVIRTGFDHILAANAALTLTIRLRKQVDSISAKKQLTNTDSLTLMRDLDSLQHIQLTLPH